MNQVVFSVFLLFLLTSLVVGSSIENQNSTHSPLLGNNQTVKTTTPFTFAKFLETAQKVEQDTVVLRRSTKQENALLKNVLNVAEIKNGTLYVNGSANFDFSILTGFDSPAEAKRHIIDIVNTVDPKMAAQAWVSHDTQRRLLEEEQRRKEAQEAQEEAVETMLEKKQRDTEEQFMKLVSFYPGETCIRFSSVDHDSNHHDNGTHAMFCIKDAVKQATSTTAMPVKVVRKRRRHSQHRRCNRRRRQCDCSANDSVTSLTLNLHILMLLFSVAVHFCCSFPY